jgi:hypothetical protein
LTARRGLLSLAILLGSGFPVLAQDWSAGASIGLANDVQSSFQLEGFNQPDWNVWVGFELEKDAELRGTYGSLKVNGSNAGMLVSIPPGAPPAPLPDLTDRINYVTVGVSYEFWEGDYTSGLFGGIGGYGVRPESVDPQYQPYLDAKATVFGLHFGADARLRVISRFSLIGRLTFHWIDSSPNKRVLTADVGVAYRF